jgi:hypothetical protein
MTRSVARRRAPELFHCLLDREGAGLLARRELLEADEMLPHKRLRRDEHEGVLDEPPDVIARLVCSSVISSPLEVQLRRFMTPAPVMNFSRAYSALTARNLAQQVL